MPATPGARLRVVAIAEAVSWLGLLTGMAFKYVLSDNEIGVKIFGPIHGAIFVLYVLTVLVVQRRLRWDLVTTGLALAASVPPFATVVFEMWAQRTGRLDAPASATPTGPPVPEQVSAR